jgi:hypothetical protein
MIQVDEGQRAKKSEAWKIHTWLISPFIDSSEFIVPNKMEMKVYSMGKRN